MPFTLVLLLGSAVVAAPVANLDFADGRRTHWTGEGFYVTTGTSSGPSLRCGVCSSDVGTNGRTALLHRTFVVPPGAGAITFKAAAVRPAGVASDKPLEITLEAAGGRYIPRQVREGNGWRSAPHLLPGHNGRPHEYLWPVEDLIGQPVRIVLHDADDRPGCYVFCTGFRMVSADEWNGRAFAAHMIRLERTHHLAPMARLDSKHFRAISNAAEEYTEERLYNCETIYAVFFTHFRKKGFKVREPGSRLMAAIFDSQAGFEAYLGQPMPSTTTGIYHPPSNRLVVYDYARNRSFVAGKKKGEQLAGQLGTPLDRQRFSGSFSRFAQARRADANVGTIMHEVAHQLSFNSGLLNRDGDVPLWLAEGLACYCEATANGSWQGIGEPNAQRAGTLAGPARGNGPFLPLRDLLTSDNWMRKAPSVQQVLLGYAQSWALFRMLMEQRPRHPAQLPGSHLLASDAGAAFGGLGPGLRDRPGYLGEAVSGLHATTRPPRSANPSSLVPQQENTSRERQRAGLPPLAGARGSLGDIVRAASELHFRRLSLGGVFADCCGRRPCRRGSKIMP